MLTTQPMTTDHLAAVKALGTSKDPLAVDSLVRELDTRNEPLREAAIEALKQLKASVTLASRLMDARQPERSRQLAARGLRFLRDEASIPALVLALKDVAPVVRAEAALALSMFGAATAETALMAALEDPTKDVRYYAADALGSVKTVAAKRALEKRLAEEQDPTVSFSIRTALDKHAR